MVGDIRADLAKWQAFEIMGATPTPKFRRRTLEKLFELAWIMENGGTVFPKHHDVYRTLRDVEVVRKRESGATFDEIACEYGLSRQSIENILERHAKTQTKKKAEHS